MHAQYYLGEIAERKALTCSCIQSINAGRSKRPGFAMLEGDINTKSASKMYSKALNDSN
jgi:hypothetical protein